LGQSEEGECKSPKAKAEADGKEAQPKTKPAKGRAASTQAKKPSSKK